MLLKKSVLLVEDDQDLLEYAEELLNQLGYRVFAVETANEAFKLLETGTQLDLLLSDIRLPGGVSGIELAKNVQERFPDTKVLLASGYDEYFLRKTVQEAFPFIEKPYRAASLKSIINSILEEY